MRTKNRARPRLLIVDDEKHLRSSLASWFGDEGYAVDTACDAKQAVALLREHQPEIILLDVRMPDGDGLDLQQQIVELTPDATVIVMTAYASVSSAVRALKQGAYDYVIKPFNPEELSHLVAKAAERYALIRENRELRRQLRASEPDLIHQESSPLARVIDEAIQVAPTDTSVLLSGESGTGKELVARLIHARSPRCEQPLVVVNCGALAEGVLESELFGHERGAFTGAVAQRQGRIEQADGGTLFLDEVGDMPPKVQVDLLRVLQERNVTRVGGNSVIPVDFRLIAATHRDLQQEVGAGHFRADLFYRISVFGITLPPLRQRPQDIACLADHFRQRFAEQMGRRITAIAPAALALLQRHQWPGNVRELQNAIERAIVVCRGETIEVQHLPFGGAAPTVPRHDLSLATIERQHIEAVLTGAEFNISRAAKLLGIDRVTLYNKLKRYGIDRPAK
ncbi:MAG: sigma-54-dependent Fis family transcriptional regulator [Deltaproteobacteria bacterium]|nr:sigma-54-dependent Fis family transcriptional regulator [Deltaproteobacteria bacterium]